MAGFSAYVVSFMAVASVVSALVAGIMLLNLIQRAFASDGIIWGLITIAYPPGTYLYCRKNWDVYRKPFVIITGLFSLAVILWALAKLM